MGEKVQILSCLQEVGMGLDTRTKVDKPTLSKVEADNHYVDKEYCERFYKKRLDNSFNFGDKGDSNNSKRQNYQQFCNFAFNYCNAECVVAGGHSHWFQGFFREYLPQKAPDNVRAFCHQKIRNCALVGFRIVRVQKKCGDSQSWKY